MMMTDSTEISEAVDYMLDEWNRHGRLPRLFIHRVRHGDPDCVEVWRRINAMNGIDMDQRQLELRLLASICKEDCTCCEMTCNFCIAWFIKHGEYELADRALSILESLDRVQAGQ